MKKFVLALAILIACILIVGILYQKIDINPFQHISVHYGTVNDNAINVSYKDISKNPQKYSGKVVRFKGYYYYHKEGCSLYVYKDKLNNPEDAYVPFDFNNSKLNDEEELYKFIDKLVIIEGIYNTDNKGMWGIHSGMVENISRFDIVEDISL